MKLKGHCFEHDYKGTVGAVNKMGNASWVANEIEDLVRDVKTITPKKLKVKIKKKFGVDISYYSAWNAKTIRMERIMGSFNLGYTILPELNRQILLCNPCSILTTSVDGATMQWTCTCIAFKALIDEFLNGCRPILGLDGCFLKGKYGGVIMKIRDKPLDKEIEMLNLMLMKLLNERRIKERTWDQRGLVPRALTHIEKLKTHYGDYDFEGEDDDGFVLIGTSGGRWKLNLLTHTFFVANITMYHHMWQHIQELSMLSLIHQIGVRQVETPLLVRGPGRPKKVRRKDADEGGGQQKKCGKCGMFGHIKKICKGTPAPPTISWSQPAYRVDTPSSVSRNRSEMGFDGPPQTVRSTYSLKRGGRPRWSRPKQQAKFVPSNPHMNDVSQVTESQIRGSQNRGRGSGSGRGNGIIQESETLDVYTGRGRGSSRSSGRGNGIVQDCETLDVCTDRGRGSGSGRGRGNRRLNALTPSQARFVEN
ncbi:hypothetical protein GIB67_018482 [Kingdonia uniflora]|uniref:CCHC-type domain-containing protein n=1 Tax=Kingdonia uniflora TaxID=39325 RepID=A0A7J7LW70_9MAGN|nr:hypothetical protein GIB67_018482 [Kingdonia uniflora]